MTADVPKPNVAPPGDSPETAPPPTDSPLEVAAPPGGNQINKVVASLVATLCLFCLGAVAGALVATRIVQPDQMGWDRLSDTIGGLVVGGLLSFPLSIYLILKNRPRTLYIVAALAAAALLVLLLVFRATNTGSAG